MDNLELKNRQSSIVNRQSQSAFTLIELMIVVSILGILAAIVYPEFQGHVQQAKEAQAKANLKLLREAIERYAANNNGVPPGYPNNDPTREPLTVAFPYHLTNDGKYLRTMPKNPFNQLSNIKPIGNANPFPESATADEVGWIYKPSTREIRLNWPGTDSEGLLFFDY